MGSNIRRHLAIALVGVTGAVLTAACGAEDSPRAEPSEKLVDARNSIDELAATRLGADYACTTARGASGADPGGLELRVTRDSARAAAESLLEDKVAPSIESTVIVVSQRLGYEEMQHVYDGIWDDRPPRSVPRSKAQVGHEMPVNVDHCPRVIITMEEKDSTTPAMEEWASASIDKYGDDRVTIERRDMSGISLTTN